MQTKYFIAERLNCKIIKTVCGDKKATTFMYQVAFISKSYIPLGSVIVFRWNLWAQTPKFSVPLDNYSRIFFL